MDGELEGYIERPVIINGYQQVEVPQLNIIRASH